MSRWTARQFRRYVAGRGAPRFLLRGRLARVRHFLFYKRLIDPEDPSDVSWVYVDTERFKARERWSKYFYRIEVLAARARARRLGLPFRDEPAPRP